MINCNLKIGFTFLTVVGALCASIGGVVSPSYAVPLETFDHPVEVSCATSASCSRSLRSKTTLGAYTGILIRGDAAMNSSFAAKNGKLSVQASGSSLRGVLFSWDSDTHPEQLSGAGLKCFDMRFDGGTAIVIKNFSLQGSCRDRGLDGECPPFTIETRVYDAGDPTGETYSASVLRRVNGRESEDLIIPFSNFNRKGLRGEGRFGCVGAVSFNVRMDSYLEVSLNAGPIFTNSLHPLDPLAFAATPTPVPVTPTRMNLVMMDSATVTPTPTPSVVGSASPVASPGPSPFPSLASTPNDTLTPLPRAPTLEKVVVAPLRRPAYRPERELEDMIYGEIVSE